MSTCRIPSKGIFQNITLRAAYSILNKRNMLDMSVEVITEHYILYTSPRKLITDWMANNGVDMARVIGPIRFVGGPPGKTKLYNGSLLTLILDAVFTSRAQEATRGTNT